LTLSDVAEAVQPEEWAAPGAYSDMAAFAREGFLGPISVFSRAECRRIAAYLRRQDHPAPPDWEKGRAVRERFLFELAMHPAILPLVTSLLGDDVVLWGVSKVVRAPGARHPWHTDIESSNPDGRFVTAWIGIEQTTRESALQVISRSHTLGKSVQEYRVERGLRRDLVGPETMLSAVRESDPEASLVQPDMTDGDAMLFDGRLWHGSHNSRGRGRRVALLFQYAAADTPVRIPDLSQLDWPFRVRTDPRPCAVLVSGTDWSQANRLVPAPPLATGLPMVTTSINQLSLPIDAATKAWQVFPAFRGPTATLTDMSCHASVLAPGQSPHPPHAHGEEELLIPLHGQVDLRIAQSPTDPTPRVEHIGPNDFVYYPAGQHHTICNSQPAPVGYLMFKWIAPSASRSNGARPLPTTICHYGDVMAPRASGPCYMHRVFEGPTAYLGRLHTHVTILQPGGGYEPHVDAYDVAIVTLSGTVETLGQRVEPLSVIYYAAGERHGMRNVGTGVARYLVFEFHAPGVDGVRNGRSMARVLPRRVLNLGKRLARPIWQRLRRV